MKTSTDIPTLHAIQAAQARLEGIVRRTPVLTSSYLDKLTQARLFFKCENFQGAGAFKYRGANNALKRLLETSHVKVVATHSSGNHAGALAKAAEINQVACIVVMPDNSPKIKIDAVREYGAEIVFCSPSLEARESTLKKVIEERDAIFIHPYNNFDIIAGQGTACLELLEDQPHLQAIVAPVGGGGLLSGTSIYAKGKNRDIRVYGAEPFGADDAWKSLKENIIVPSENPQTMADGLLTSLGTLTFKAISTYTDDILRVSEEGISEAMSLLFQRMKIVVEPSACVGLAAVLAYPELFKDMRTGIILSGGNVDFSIFESLR